MHIKLLSPQHLSVPLRRTINLDLRCHADPDRAPPVCQYSVSVISSVQPPYQLLASGSPSGKLQDSIMHFRGIQRPCFPVETKHERINAVSVCLYTTCTMSSVSEYKCRVTARKFCFFCLFPHCGLHQSSAFFFKHKLTWLSTNTEQ